MAERYKLPDGVLGGGEVEETEAHSTHDVPASYVAVFFPPTDGNPARWYGYLPRAMLTPVKPPTPAEPEPGLYLLGEVVALRRPTDDGTYRWFSISAGAPHLGTGWTNWETVWREVGGPDVTITRLVPEERVEAADLPWAHTDQDGDELYVIGSSASLLSGARLRLGVGPRSERRRVDLNADACRTLAAILTAAGRS